MMPDEVDPVSAAPPRAVVESAPVRRSLAGLVWLVPLAAVALAVALGVKSYGDRGPLVEVFADHGYGLGAGDAVRYLGIEVGRLEEVGLEPDSEGVRLAVRLAPDAAGLAREGTRFWIVRPELSLDSVEGLETIIGAQYLALTPGPAGGNTQLRFTALPEIPLTDELESERGLEVVLDASARYGLSPGAALTYRGVRIGTVTSVGLASDATRVEVRLRVRGAYTQLVRERSVFWETGGFEFALSLSGGLEVDLDSLKTAFVGGIALATPVDAGPAVTDGARFVLHDDPEEDWLDWRPALPLGNDLLPEGATLPRLMRATLAWREGRILKSDESKSGWLQVTPEGLVGPADLMRVPDDAREGRATLRIAGRELDLARLLADGLVADVESAPGLLGRLAPGAFGTSWEGLAATAQPGRTPRSLAAAEDLILVREAGRDPIGVDATRLQVHDTGATIDEIIPLTVQWHGAAALARRDGAPVGVVLIPGDGGPARIVAR